MSTKIWEAYRLREGVDLWEFLRYARGRAEKNARKTISEHIQRVVRLYRFEPSSRKKIEECLPYNPETPEQFNPLSAANYWRTRYIEKKTIDFSCSLSIRELNGRYYLIPHDAIEALRFLRRDKRLEDFHYQNQADQPKHISNKEWKHREKIWDVIAGDADESWWDYVALEVVCPDNWYRIDPAIYPPMQRYWERLKKDDSKERAVFEKEREDW